MALEVVVDSLESLPEPLREHYVATDDGKYRLDGVEDTGVLKRSLENAKKERAEAKAALERLKGIDPEEYNRLKAEREEREMQAATKKGEFEKLKQQMVEKHQQELSSRETEVKSLRSSLESYLIDAEATRAIAGAKGSPELLLPHVRANVRVVQEDGQFVARVVDKEGNPRIGDAAGAPMTINQLVAEMRQSEVYGRAFEGTGASGSGAPQNRSSAGGGQKSMTRSAFDALGAAEKASFVRGGGTLTD